VTRAQRLRAVWLLLFVGACFGIAVYLFSVAGTSLIPGSEPYRVQVVVPNAVSLAPAADVSEAGVDIGRVKKIRDLGDRTVLQLEIHGSDAPVYRDARVLIRAKSIAGENYVELDRGRPAAGSVPSGGLLSVDHAGEATQIDQIFSIFDDTRRRDLQRIIAGLGGGLADGGSDLNRTLEASAAVPAEGAAALSVFAHDRDHVARLVDSFGRVTRALGDRASSIQLLTRQAKAAAEAVALRDASLRSTLHELPALVRQAGTTGENLTRFAAAATPVVHDLRLATTQLIPAVRDLRPAAAGGQAAVRELDRFARAAVPAIAQLSPFSRKATGFAAPLGSFLRQANPLFAYLVPYAREMSTFFALPAASFQQTDALGHVARILLPISRSDLSGVLTPDEEQQLQALDAPFDTRGTNAYPVPAGAGDPKPFSGSYPRLEAEGSYTR
jgi:phospholipid/cholesterol/gamma-HCH transport system substrate-binding protein